MKVFFARQPKYPLHIPLAVLALVIGLWSCGTRDRALNTDELSDQLSISNLNRLPIRTAGSESMIVGVAIDVDVVNVGNLVIDDAILMTWSLVAPAGGSLGLASRQLAAGLAPGERRNVTLNITLSPVTDLNGVQDVVTFDLVN